MVKAEYIAVALIFTALLTISVGYISYVNNAFTHPSVSNVTFELLNKDEYQILTTDGVTFLFEYKDGISRVMFNDQWGKLKIGKQYTCEKRTYACIFPQTCSLVYPHVSNCVEV